MAKSKDGVSNLSSIDGGNWHGKIKWVKLCKRCAKDEKKCVCNKAGNKE